MTDEVTVFAIKTKHKVEITVGFKDKDGDREITINTPHNSVEFFLNDDETTSLMEALTATNKEHE